MIFFNIYDELEKAKSYSREQPLFVYEQPLFVYEKRYEFGEGSEETKDTDKEKKDIKEDRVTKRLKEKWEREFSTVIEFTLWWDKVRQNLLINMADTKDEYFLLQDREYEGYMFLVDIWSNQEDRIELKIKKVLKVVQ